MSNPPEPSKFKEWLVQAIESSHRGSLRHSKMTCLPAAILFSGLALFYFGEGPVIQRLGWYALGIFNWTFMEYCLHRWLLHAKPAGPVSQAFLNRLHIHHHNSPKDESHVFLPFEIMLLLWLTVYGLVSLTGALHSTVLIITSGTALMMVLYDFVHFSVHYYNPKGKVANLLKKHHMLHHFADPTKRFGVTTTFWDYIFGTKS